MLNSSKIREILFLSFLGVVFLSLIFLVFRQFQTSEYEKILNKDLKEIKENQKQLIENEKRNYQSIDSIKKQRKQKENTRDGFLERYKRTQEFLNQKIKEDEDKISNTNVDNDSIKSYLSNYRYKPFK